MILDSLINFVANLGTPRDKAAGAGYHEQVITDDQLTNAYRFHWLPRKVVDIPALDATRKWRNWQADNNQIQQIEAEEKRLGLRAKVLNACTKARLYGGAGIYISIKGDTDPSLPLNAENIKRGGIDFIAVLPRRVLTATELETDPSNPRYGKPKAYRISGTTNIEIVHYSRIVAFIGNPHPDEELQSGVNYGWGDSSLSAALDVCKNADATLANIVSLIYESKVDVLGIPSLGDVMADAKTREALVKRVELAAILKGNNGMFVRDAEETYESKTFSFSNLDNIGNLMLQVVSGAADIPATRLIGRSPAGMNSTGESDTRNYYDRIQAMQELEFTPALAMLDECLIRSALGTRPEEIHYRWAPLWQATEKERADNGKTVADTIKVLADTRLFPDEALSQAAETTLVEWGILPGLEAAMEEFGDLPVREENEGTQEDGAAAVQDAAPRTLYVHRKVKNAAEIITWAKSQGFGTTLAADDMHVTIAFSRDPLDWMKVGEAWNHDQDGGLTVKPGGARLVEQFGGGAIVLLFNSAELSWRHCQIKDAGASWDWPEYQPHITITYSPGDVEIEKIEPYRGAIELGPEVFEEVKEDWKAAITEE